MDYESLTKEQLIEVLRRRDTRATYGLHWENKEIEHEKALNRDFVGLELDPAVSEGAAPWKNMVIEGDNFDTLRHLATTHSSSFDLVYGDIPYNTGSRDFVYNDRYFDPTNRYRHSTWLEFIHQRMMLIKPLLKEDGAVVISIDDNELFNLGLLMHQVFGEKAFIANCIWQKRYSRDNNSAIGDVHEYLLVYSPNPDKFKARRGRLALDEKSLKHYRNAGLDDKGPWRLVPMNGAGIRPNQQYLVELPNGRKIPPPEGRHWSVLEPEFLRLKAEGKVSFGVKGDSAPGLIRYLSEVSGLVPWTWWPHEEVGHTDESRKEIQDILGSQMAFDTPKPVRLMERVLQICAPEKHSLVLDPFAGSGTMAHAVLKMNKEDGGSRRFVMASNREATDENPEKNLCRDVCAKRISKVITGYESGKTGAVEGLGGDFAYLRATRVPMHRLEENLTDAMVWNFGLLACDHPVSPGRWPVATSVRESDSHMVVYCINTKTATLSELCEVVQAHQGKVAVLSWAPKIVEAALGDLAARVSMVDVPADFVLAFKQGNSRATVTGEAPE